MTSQLPSNRASFEIRNHILLGRRIQSVQVTAKNAYAVSEWCKGVLRPYPAEICVEVPTKNGIMFAFIGYFVLKFDDGSFEVRSKKPEAFTNYTTTKETP